MANDINRVALIGRLTRDPELKATNTGASICRLTLASNRTIFKRDAANTEEVGYFDCIAWGKLGEMISKYAQKGKRVAVDGSLRWSSWESSDGKKSSKVEIHVENFQFLDAKPAEATGNSSTTTGKTEPQGLGFDEPFNDDIPF